jgi:hypothetical protein
VRDFDLATVEDGSWATGLRIAGNEAAHVVDAEVAPEDARDVIEFTEALLSYAFSLNRRFEEFRLRRAARESNESGAAVTP